jgi:hypothetical protein
MLLLPLVSDETRVLAIVTFPLIASELLLNHDFLKSVSGRFVALTCGLWTIVPWSWAFGGRPLVSVFPYDLAYLLHRFFGWFAVPQNQPLWPF